MRKHYRYLWLIPALAAMLVFLPASKPAEAGGSFGFSLNFGVPLYYSSPSYYYPSYYYPSTTWGYYWSDRPYWGHYRSHRPHTYYSYPRHRHYYPRQYPRHWGYDHRGYGRW